MSTYFIVGVVAIIAMPLWFFLLSYLEDTYEGNFRWLFESRKQMLLTMFFAAMISIIAYIAYVLALATNMSSMFILRLLSIISVAGIIILLFIMYIADFWKDVEKKQRIKMYLGLIDALILFVIVVTSALTIGISTISLF